MSDDVEEIEIRFVRNSEKAHKAAFLARELIEAVRLGDSTMTLVMDGVLDGFNQGPEAERLEGLAYLLACFCGLVLHTAAVGDELAGRDDVVLGETLQQCRESGFTF